MRQRIRIIYKSGATMDATCDEFIVSQNLLGERVYRWAGMRPDPLVLGADDIAAVWNLGSDATPPHADAETVTSGETARDGGGVS